MSGGAGVGPGKRGTPRSVEAVFALLLRAQPRSFRAERGEELLEFYREAWSDQAMGRGMRRGLGVLVQLSADALRSGLARRVRGTLGERSRGQESDGFGRKEVRMDAWLQDVRWAVRSVTRQPGFAAIVMLTLALGVGANTAVFGVLNAVLLTPLPYAEPERLVRIYQGDRDVGGPSSYLTQPALLDVRDNARTLEIGMLYTYRPEGADLTQGDRPERVRQLKVSAGYFGVLRVTPVLGRVFRQEEETAEAGVVVISRRIHERYFGGGDVLGRTLNVDRVSRTVIGVVAEEFEDPIEGAIDVWLPLPLRASGHEEWEWDNQYLTAIARLKPGVTRAAAQSEMNEMTRRQGEAHPAAEGKTALVVPLQDDLVGRSATLLAVLMAAVALLLLIACVNVASLFLARGAARASDLAVRSAIGSPRRRLVRQLLSESLLLALGGGVLGLGLALLFANLLASIAPAELRLDGATLDARMFTFALLVSLASGALFGATPAFRFTRPGLSNVLRESGRNGAAGRAEGRARNVLVVAEFSLALVLLIGAGVLLKSFDRLRQVPLNIRTSDVMTFEVHLPEARYEEPAQRARFHESLTGRLSQLSGVRSVGAVSRLPVSGRYHSWGTRRGLSATEVDRSEPHLSTDQRVVDGAYFEALGIPLLRGRVFGPEDAVDAPGRVVVSQAFANALFGEEDPLGRHVLMPRGFREIIGVVADVPVTARGDVVPMVYHEHAQFADDRNWALTYVVALNGPGSGLLDAARRELAALDPELVLYNPRPLAEAVGRGVAQERFAMLLLGCFAALAVVLAAIGIYGVLAYSVTRRRPEIGLRLALGARATEIQGMVVGQGARLAAIGIALGLAGALALTRWLSALVFEVSVTDPWVFAGCAALLLAIAVVASGVPAYAATRVNPVETMRRD